MRQMIQGSGVLADLGIELYGKSGTAQESETRPDHGLFIGHSHYGSQEDIAFAVRIAYGYSSTNAATVVKDVLNYYYGLEDASRYLPELPRRMTFPMNITIKAGNTQDEKFRKWEGQYE